MSEQPIITSKKDGKATIVINRPKVLNALDWTSFFRLQDELNALIADDSIRVIILTGAACDFVICSENAQFGVPEAGLGVICGFGGNIKLPRKIKEMLMTGKFIDAFCADLLSKNTITLELIKKAIGYGLETDLRTAVQYEDGLFGVVSATEDKFEGMGAFMEKRKRKNR